MSYLFQVIETEPQSAVVMRKVTSANDLPKVVEEVFNNIVEYVSKKEGLSLGPAYIAYYSMDENNLEVEIGFPVSEEIPGEGEITCTKIPGGKRVVGYYKGAYAYMTYLYDEMLKWILLNNLEPSSLVYEYYFNSPQDVPENELLTKVEFLLKTPSK
jgi:effector-binding domain-containing protein